MRYAFMNQVKLNMISVFIIAFSSIFCFACNQTSTKLPSSTDSSIEKTEAIKSDENTRSSIAQHTDPDALKYCIVDSSIGAGGYDLVNYFTNNSAELGSEEHTETYDGVKYYFKSDEHQSLFKANPTKYLPAYGGWCSMTLAMGRATKPTYDNFKIIDGKLHLFERTLSINGQSLWVQDPNRNAKLAEKNYSDYQDVGVIRSN